MDFTGAYSAENLKFLLDGLYVTLIVAFVSIFLSFIIGCIVASSATRRCRCCLRSCSTWWS